MGFATSFTSDRMLDIEQNSVVAGLVDLNGDLILEKKSGSTFNAGHVVGPEGPQGPSGLELLPADLNYFRGTTDQRIAFQDTPYCKPKVKFYDETENRDYTWDGSIWIPKPNGFFYTLAYAPGQTGAAPTSESTAMIVGDVAIPPEPYHRILSGLFTAAFTASSATTSRIIYAGMQLIDTGTNPARDTAFHNQQVFSDNSTAARTLQVPFQYPIYANEKRSVRLLQWASVSTISVSDANGICYSIMVTPAY